MMLNKYREKLVEYEKILNLSIPKDSKQYDNISGYVERTYRGIRELETNESIGDEVRDFQMRSIKVLLNTIDEKLKTNK